MHDNDNYASIQCAITSPNSRGNVTISSSNINDHPVINLNLLTTTTDQEVAVQAFKRARQLAQSIGITVGPEVTPGEAVKTNDQILQWLKETTVAIHHASATCRTPKESCSAYILTWYIGAMGKEGDPNAVVNASGSVFGVSGLRVVDASAFPFLPPGHTQSTVCKSSCRCIRDVPEKKNSFHLYTIDMLAEKIADEIMTQSWTFFIVRHPDDTLNR